MRLAAALWWQALLLRQRFTLITIASAGAGHGGSGGSNGNTPHSEGPQQLLLGVASLTPNAGPQAVSGLPKQLQSLCTAVVSNMAVAAAARRRGHGRALLAACEREAAQQGYAAVALLVHEYNEPARR